MQYIFRKIYALLTIVLCIVLAGCTNGSYTVPTQASAVDQQAPLYPDYRDITIPANIAPLNFIVRDSTATRFVAELKGTKGEAIVAGGEDDGKVLIDSTAWRQLLADNRGADISVTIYAEHEGAWTQYKSHTLTIAQEDIDPYLSYRLIEPGYELYRQLGLYQRNLTNFDEETIYENNREYRDSDNHCINCHNYQNYSTKRMLFHVRASHGGTILVDGDKCERIQLKDSTILTAGVYPSWHPTKNLVAFSTNQTGQTFHLYHEEKIEVLDQASDLILYDVDKNEVSHILRSESQLETFPCWSTDGNRLYYCSTRTPRDPRLSEEMQEAYLVHLYDSLCYNIMYLDYDQQSGRFSQPQTFHDFASIHKSASFPRISPDGRYLLYALGDYGQFHIWHKSSDLWVTDLQNDSTYALTEANSPDVDSYHTWSSNGRWIVFSSRRMDGNYTRPFIAYFDRQGHAHKAFCLPQEDPEYNILLLKSYNVPELTKDRVQIAESTLRDCIYGTGDKAAIYKKVDYPKYTNEPKADAATGASPKKATPNADAATGASPKKAVNTQ